MSDVIRRVLRERWYISFLLVLVPLLALTYGIPEIQIVKDAKQFHTLAINLLSGHGFSIDGNAFNAYREPAYPIFLTCIYAIFGLVNVHAVFIAQLLLVGAVAYIAHRVFEDGGRPLIGFAAGLAI